jgi:hypothetical protein
MTSRLLTIRSRDIPGKKGRLTAEALAEIAGRVPAALLSGPLPSPRTTLSHNKRDHICLPASFKGERKTIRKFVGTGAARHAGSVILPIR